MTHLNGVLIKAQKFRIFLWPPCSHTLRNFPFKTSLLRHSWPSLPTDNFPIKPVNTQHLYLSIAPSILLQQQRWPLLSIARPSTWGLAPILSLLEESVHPHSNVLKSHHLKTLPFCSQTSWKSCVRLLCYIFWPPALSSHHCSPTIADLHWLTGTLHFANTSGHFSVLVLLDVSEKSSSVDQFFLLETLYSLAVLWQPISGSPSPSQLSLLRTLPYPPYPAFKCWSFSKLRLRLFSHSKLSIKLSLPTT